MTIDLQKWEIKKLPTKLFNAFIYKHPGIILRLHLKPAPYFPPFLQLSQIGIRSNYICMLLTYL